MSPVLNNIEEIFLKNRPFFYEYQVIGTNQKLDDSYHLYLAMGNASDAIKAQADFVTDTNMNDGVAKVVEEFVLKIVPVQ